MLRSSRPVRTSPLAWRLGAALLLTAALPWIAPASAGAQLVAGRVLEEGSDAPIGGAFVVLAREDSTPLVGGLTNTDGSFALRVEGPGRYRLRVERIGYRSAITDAFPVAAGERVVRDVVVRSQPVDVGRVDVSSTGRCVLRPEEGEPTWRLWSEARKALEVTLWTEAQRELQFAIARFERRVDPEGLFVWSEEVELGAALAGRAFLSGTAERLQRFGYVRGDRAEREYYLPDATVLLSDTFLDDHCFRLLPDDGSGLRRVRFEPADPRSTADVEGILWLDAESHELRTLEVRYVNPGLPGKVEPRRFGGELHFARLPDGAWIVSRWRIRMPAFHRTGVLGLRVAVHHFVESEGEVLRVRTAAGAPIAYRRAAAEVTGTVRHPETGQALKGAEVVLVGTPYRALTDSEGRFTLEGLPGHRYRLRLAHDALQPAPPPLTVTLVRGETLQVDPSGRSP